MKRIFVIIGLCAGLLVLAACTTAGQSGGDLTGRVWVLSELGGNPPVSGTGITAKFTADGKVGGSAGCNRYAGQYTVSGNNITFASPLASTMMMCEQPVMDQESAYLKALAEAKTYSVSGDQLTLKDADGSKLTVFNAQSQDLAGTSWEVLSYNNGKQAVTSVLAGTTLTAVFDKDGNLSGTAGCNNYNGSYKVDGEQITIGPLAATMMFCNDPEGVMDQETQYLAALQTAATYQVEGAVLELRTKDGALAVSFTKK